MGVRGLILQPTYRLEAGRPVIHLYGRLETGEPFLVRDDREIPHFFVRARDTERAHRFGADRIVPSQRLTMAGEPVARVELGVPSDTPPLRNRLLQNHIPCFEADVRFAMRFLISRGIRASLEIEGPWRTISGLGRVYENPTITPASWAPRLSALSLDIETDPSASQLLSIALVGCGASEVLLLEPEGFSSPEGSIPFRHERQLLAAFCRRVRELDPDVLTGWNVVDFDLRVLDRLARVRGVTLRLGRDREALRLRRSRSPWSSSEALLSGRVVLDGIDLLRGSYIKLDQYSLDFVAKEVLGEGKTMGGAHRAEQILDAFERDRTLLVEYNLTDAKLVLDILGKLKLLELATERSLLTGLPVDRVAGSIAAFDFLYLSELHKQRLVAPSVDTGQVVSGDSNPGGHVLEPEPGLYENVWVFDFKSLYPSLIRTFHIDPLGFVSRPAPDANVIVAPNGAAFERRPGILPRLLDSLFPRREAAKSAGEMVAAHAIKILMNSFYGVLGTPACRFYRPELAGAITTFGREILLWSKSRLESLGYRVLYGDTDSLFVLSGAEDVEVAEESGGRLTARLNRDLTEYIEKTWDVESRLELEFETLYRKLHLPVMRGSRSGARKRYVGLVGEGDQEEIVYTGMEVVRRDWTDLAKQVQRELYRRLFAGLEVQDYLSTVVGDLRRGDLDDLLVYRKGLRKNLEAYTTTTPPHVAAARKMSRPPGRLISYVITTGGPEPIHGRTHPIDHEHYVQKQIRPIAEPLLELLGLNFDKVIGDDTQLELF